MPSRCPGPTPTNGSSVPVAFGGNVPASFARVAKHGIGWTAGGSTPEQAGEAIGHAKAAWAKAGRAGQPRTWALTYFGLSADAQATGEKPT